jgi:hypothetical protein
VEMLFGLARQLRWFAAQYGPAARPDSPSSQGEMARTEET